MNLIRIIREESEGKNTDFAEGIKRGLELAAELIATREFDHFAKANKPTARDAKDFLEYKRGQCV